MELELHQLRNRAGATVDGQLVEHQDQNHASSEREHEAQLQVLLWLQCETSNYCGSELR